MVKKILVCFYASQCRVVSFYNFSFQFLLGFVFYKG